MSISKRSHTQQVQFEVMVDFMVKHPDLAKGILKVPDAKTKSRNLWERLTLDLNAVSSPSRDVNGWKKVWADYKNNIKNKCRRNKSSISGTGGGPSKYCSLTPLEDKVVQLLSIDEAVSGIPATSAFGIVPSTSTNSVLANSDIRQSTSAQSTSVSSLPINIIDQNENNGEVELNLSTEEQNNDEYTPNRQIRKDKPSDKDNLLRKQVENQILYQENTSKTLTDLHISLQNTSKILSDINNNIAGMQKYIKRSYELQERKYKLEKEKFELKKITEMEKSKRKLEQLELKKRIYELELEKHGVKQ